MTVNDVKVGQVYLMRRGAKSVSVRIIREVSGGFKSNRRNWIATNLSTGREIRIKSAVNLQDI